MKLLYLSEDYPYSKVHHQLLSRLQGNTCDIVVFTVIRLSDKSSDIRQTYKTINYRVENFSLSPYLEIPYRFFFNLKVKIKLRKILQCINPEEFNVIHASTLFSEGAVAYELFKRFGIPYTVAIRGTDLNFYMSKMPHLWETGRNILKHASKIIFITPNLQINFLKKNAVRPVISEINNKCVVIPNGIEDFWVNNPNHKKDISTASRILYIGRFDKNKNVEKLVKSVLELRKHFPKIRLDLVGGGDSCHHTIMNYCSNYPDVLNYYGKVYDKDRLLEIIRDNDIFAMVSHSETFGLVYLEALSQGLPILYTAEQGIDKSVPDSVGEKASSTDQDAITNQLRKLITDYPTYQELGDSIKDFSWDQIAQKYKAIFELL